jgi:hypothetical protein
MTLIEKYRNFIETIDSNPFDFQPKAEEIYFDFINELEKGKFTVIGKNKAGCLICEYNKQKAMKDAPILWLDSERSPSGIFTNNLETFFSLLPYGMGFLYKIISNGIDINNNLTDFVDCSKFEDERRQMLKKNSVAGILPAYEKSMGISIAKKPCENILQSIRKHWNITERIIKK